MIIHTELESHDESECAFFDDNIVAYTRTLEVCGDYVTLTSLRKPSLTEYDAFER